jgi:hypothetical protein
MGIQKWSGVPGQFVAELHVQNGEIYDAHSDKQLEVDLGISLEQDESYELVIEFRSEGYYDPGVVSGPPERCYPPEGDDERSLDGMTLTGEKGDMELSQETQEELFEYYRSEVEDVEIDKDYDGGMY